MYVKSVYQKKNNKTYKREMGDSTEASDNGMNKQTLLINWPYHRLYEMSQGYEPKLMTSM